MVVAGVQKPPDVGCKPLLGEWQLHLEVVLSIWDIYGSVEVDLFATEGLTRCLLWLSWTEETSTLDHDALVHD